MDRATLRAEAAGSTSSELMMSTPTHLMETGDEHRHQDDEHLLHAPLADVLAGGEIGVDAGQHKFVEEQPPHEDHDDEKHRQQGNLLRLHGENVADQIGGILRKPPLAESSTTPSARPVLENTPMMVSAEETPEPITAEMPSANSSAKPSMESR